MGKDPYQTLTTVHGSLQRDMSLFIYLQLRPPTWKGQPKKKTSPKENDPRRLGFPKPQTDTLGPRDYWSEVPVQYAVFSKNNPMTTCLRLSITNWSNITEMHNINQNVCSGNPYIVKKTSNPSTRNANASMFCKKKWTNKKETPQIQRKMAK